MQTSRRHSRRMPGLAMTGWRTAGAGCGRSRDRAWRALRFLLSRNADGTTAGRSGGAARGRLQLDVVRVNDQPRVSTMSILQIPHAHPSVILFDWHATLADTMDAMYYALDDVMPRLAPLGLIERLVPSGKSKTIEDARLAIGRAAGGERVGRYV